MELEGQASLAPRHMELEKKFIYSGGSEKNIFLLSGNETAKVFVCVNMRKESYMNVGNIFIYLNSPTFTVD